MGKRGPIPRPPAQLHGRSKARLTLLEGQEFDPGDPPFGHQLDAWDEYWRSPSGDAARPEDLPAVRRLFQLRAHFDAAIQIASADPKVEGSTGQIRPTPFYATALSIEAAILRLENELGLTPRARAALGLTAAQAGLTVQQINERLTQTAEARTIEAWALGGAEDDDGAEAAGAD